MSTHDLQVKLSGVKSRVEQHTVRGGNDQSLTSKEYLQSKNLYIRLLKSKTDQGSTAEGQNETPDQLRFTSFYSLRFPSTRSEKNRTDNKSDAQLSSNILKPNDVKRPAEVQHPKLCENTLPPNSFRETGTVIKNENESIPLEYEGTDSPQQSHLRYDTSNYRGIHTGGIQCGVALYDPTPPGKNSSQKQSPGSEHLTELQVTESTSAARESGVNDHLGENAEETLSHSNIIPFAEDSSSKASTNCQPSACSPRALKRALSLPSFPAPHHSCKLETSLIGASSAMFTSTIVSVLAPHWSSRLRRHKRGSSDVEQDIQVSGQNSSLSASSQNATQQPFPVTQMKKSGNMFDEFNNKLRESAGTSKSAVEWQKDSSSSHFMTTLQEKRPVLKPSPLDTNQQTVDRASVPLPMDTGQVPRSPVSPQLTDYKRMSQPEDQGESFSPPTSRPTTSNLLLSWRRINSRKANAESTEMEKQLALSVSSLTLPSKSILKVSQPNSPLVSPEDPTKDIFVPYIFPESPERLSGAEQSPVSPRGGDMDISKKSMFLSKREFAISSRTFARTDTSKESRFSSTSTRFSQPEILRAPHYHSHKILERKYSHIGNSESVDQNSNAYAHLHNSNVNRLHTTANYPSTCTSTKDNTNNNTETLISPSYYNTDTVSTYMQSNGTYDIISSKANTTNAQSMSKNTKTIQTSSSAGLPSMSLTQMSQNNTQNSITNASSLCPDNLSPSLTNSVSRRTFTSSLIFSPRKEPSAVEGTSPSNVWQNYLNLRHSQSDQSPSDLKSPLSPSRPLRRVHAPSIYSYLRETSPPLTTQVSSELTSTHPETISLKHDDDQIQKENRNTRTSRFTFDLSPVESHDLILTHDSSAPQSLPPNTHRRSMPRLSKSPYSTLISKRPALNSTLHNLSSPPVSYQHNKSASDGSSPISVRPPTAEKASYPSKHKDNCLFQRISGEAVSSSDKQLISKTGQSSSGSLDTYHMSQSSPEARFTDRHPSHLISNTTHLKQVDIVVKNTPHKGIDGMSQSDKSNTYASQGLNYKEHSSPLSTLTVSENVPAVVQEEATNNLFQGIHHSNSKKSLFSRSKKDNVQTSVSPSVKKGLNHQDIKKGEMTGLKSINKMDQVLNRLKMTFGVKRSENDDLTTTKKTKNFNKQFSDLNDFESSKKREERDNERQTVSSDCQSTIVTGSFLSSSDPLSGFTFKNEEHENVPNMDMHKRFADENGNQFLGRPLSPNWPKPHYVNRYATMPQTRKTSLGPSPTLYPTEFALKTAQRGDVFHSYLPMRSKNIFIYKTEDVPQPENAVNSQSQHLMGAHLSASCADLKYGLERGRSVSVSSVVSSRPSGPGRISTGSKQSSISDITSMDEFVPRSRHSSISSAGDSPGYGVRGQSNFPVHNTYKSCAGRLQSNDNLWSPVSLETSPYPWDPETDPTPPPSPPFSPTSRRMSQIPSSSSNGSRISQDSLSPRGFLPSRNYKSTLSVFEESSSDTTTDDEYYLNSDDDYDKETEL